MLPAIEAMVQAGKTKRKINEHFGFKDNEWRKNQGMSQYIPGDKTVVSRKCINMMECYEHMPKICT